MKPWLPLMGINDFNAAARDTGDCLPWSKCKLSSKNLDFGFESDTIRGPVTWSQNLPIL
jgi:hypothetical protein